MVFKSTSPDDTHKLGQIIAKWVNRGNVIALKGDLGAGKTLLAQSITEALGVTDEVTSPTFNILNVYTIPKFAIYHFDLYRIEHDFELYDIGFEEYIYGDGISIIEWPDKFYHLLPDKDILLLTIYRGIDENDRQIEIAGSGDLVNNVIKELNIN